MTESAPNAHFIHERVMKASSDAILSGDFEAFRTCYRLPVTMESYDGQRQIDTEDDLRSFFDGLRHQMQRLGVTELYRTLIDARFLEDDTIAAMHETRLLRDTLLLHGPYPAYVVLRRVDGDWKIVHGKFAVSDSQRLSGLFSVSD